MEKAAETGYLLATDLADYLVKKGLDFRSAHHIVGTIVAYAQKKGLELKDIPLSVLKSFHPVFDEEVNTVLDLRSAMSKRNSQGGTAPQQVQKALARDGKKNMFPVGLRRKQRLANWIWVLLILCLLSCGKKTNPVIPTKVIPKGVTDLSYQVKGKSLVLSWTIPSKIPTAAP